MHIALNGWFWGQMTTGSGQYLYHLVRYLPEVAFKHTFSLIVPGPVIVPPVALPPSPPGWKLHRVSTPLDHVHRDLAKVWFEQLSFPRACRRLVADVGHVPYWGSPGWRPCRIAVTIHDLIPLLLPAYRGGLLQRAYTTLVARTARRADLVMTDSAASRSDIIARLSIPGKRVRAIPLAADERFQPRTSGHDLARVQAKYNLPEQPFVLYLGGFDVRKNVPRLVQAYGLLLRQRGVHANTPRLVIAGRLPQADTAFTPDPRRAALLEGVSDWVRFIGWVDEEDKPALYRLATVFAFPSMYEGFGLPAAEATACGVPVVTSRCSSLPEAAPGAVLVDPADVNSIAHGLAQTLAHPQTPSSLMQSQPERTWRLVAQETFATLQNV